MAKTLISVVNEVLNRLGDTAQNVWTSDEVRSYLSEGYDKLAILTECFFDQAYMEDRLTTANITNDFERNYLDPGDLYTGTFRYTFIGDQDYLEEPAEIILGPTTLNHTWESAYLDAGFSYYKAVDTLPDNLYQVQRAVWDWKKIEPLRSTDLEVSDRLYMTQNGEVMGYLMDKDGLRSFRKWRVPSVAANSFVVSGTFGVLRSPADISSGHVFGSWGVPRILPTMHPIGDTGGYGLPRRCYQETKNTRIEYSRRGRAVEADDDVFELPDRYVRYLRFFATGKCLERNGPGQDIAYADHWRQRWERGIARILTRMAAVRSNEKLEMQDNSLVNQGRPPLARPPWQFGRVVGYPVA